MVIFLSQNIRWVLILIVTDNEIFAVSDKVENIFTGKRRAHQIFPLMEIKVITANAINKINAALRAM